ncbi:MAG TPA: ATP-dependent RecD-like DNA helicase [Thermoanaerobaculia bacterium]|nr:ATP-dependent RecD-like DNA helicase [Thermoanaerobaculia bacterium]
MPDHITGVVERVVHYIDATGFCIAEVRAQDGALLKVVANCPPLERGDEIEASGQHVVHKRFGAQFKAEHIAPLLPVTPAAITRYLSSGRIPGVGPAIAARLVAKFGSGVIDVLDNSPDKLRAVEGIGEKKLAAINKAWNAQRAVWRLTAMLAEHGIGTARAARIFKQFGGDAVAIVRQNPYVLAQEIRGIGFERSDRIALSLGFDRASPLRLGAALHHVLEKSERAGNCGTPREQLIDVATPLLACDRTLVEGALNEALAMKQLIAETIDDTPVIFAPRLHKAESHIAAMLARIASVDAPFTKDDIEPLINEVESDFVLPEEKRRAIALALTNAICVITGGPGVGKTTVVNAILQIAARAELDIALAAPTGRAAKRLTQQTGHLASTIHRLLEWQPGGGFARNEDTPLTCELLVVDEMSMTDVMLFESLLRAVAPGTTLLLVGDADQLPSIGPGQVLRDIIASDVIPVASLKTVYRQGEGSSIVANAHRINRGEMPDLTNAEGTDFFFFATKDNDATRDRVVEIVAERLPKRFGLDPLRDVQVLAPMRKGQSGVEELNVQLQRRLNPQAQGAALAAGDKVMQIVNNYEKEVFNGDIGIVREATRETVVVDFDGYLVDYAADDVEQLVLAYATTVHKAQGSEFPAVVIPVAGAHTIMLQRNLLYTAVTRGKKLVVLVGEKSAIERAVRNADASKRWTRLRSCLRDGQRAGSGTSSRSSPGIKP